VEPDVTDDRLDSSGAPFLEVDRVSKTYRRGPELVLAIDEVSFVLSTGEVVALVGPSGSGKTTLLNVLAGWEKADRGEVRWDGVPMRDPDRLPWSTLALLPQRLGLIEELSMRENVELPLRLRRSDPSTRADSVTELMATLGLLQLADRPPSETSLGEQQRAALARALLLTPRLLLADEPAGHQDAGSAESVLRAIRRVAGNGTCCLVATHNMDSLRFCDRAIRIHDGRVEPMERAGRA
jgi:ABC-type lipoprotein export system ATPase subunit